MEDEELKMIPTSYKKNKIPRALSYVCGAKTLSLAWCDVPQFHLLRLAFSCSVPHALRPQKQPRELLQLYVRPSYRMEVDQGEWIWTTWIYACRREDAHDVREWLREIGLSSAREWLLRNAVTEAEPNRASWRATFDEEKREFHIEHKK